MGDMVFNLDAMTANVKLADDYVASKMARIEPFCSKLTAANAQMLRQSALRHLKVLHYFKHAPAGDGVKDAVRDFLLQRMLCECEMFCSILEKMEGTTHEERLKAYREQERDLFENDPDMWWMHRVQESYEYFAFGEKASKESQARNKSAGCVVPIIFAVASGGGLIKMLLG